MSILSIVASAVVTVGVLALAAVGIAFLAKCARSEIGGAAR